VKSLQPGVTVVLIAGTLTCRVVQNVTDQWRVANIVK
jgi:hypothetical protein